MKTIKEKEWKLIGHSHQIADTGDYAGCYELTNGKISLMTDEDDGEFIQPIVDALNNSGIKFYHDDFFEFENRLIKQQLNELKKIATSQKETIERFAQFVNWAMNQYNYCSISGRTQFTIKSKQLLSTIEPKTKEQ